MPVAAASSGSVCEDPGNQSYISAAMVDHDEVTLRGLASTSRKDQEFRAVAQGPGGFIFGFSHRYTRFDFENIAPQTNGHVHTTSLPVHWRTGNTSRNFRAALAPALSASSNVLGHPQKYSSDTARIAAALVWQQDLSERVGVRYGVCGDNRFGDYTIYPAAALEWHPGVKWKVDLGFPTSGITYRMTDSSTVALNAAPDGNEWHVMNRSFEDESFLVHKAYTVEWVFALEAGSHLSLYAKLGRQFRNSLEMTLQNGERVDIETGPVNRIGAEVRWRF